MRKRDLIFGIAHQVACGAIVLCVITGGVVFAQADSAPVVRHLMVHPNETRSVRGKDFRLHKIQAKDASGAIIKVPAKAVDIHTGVPSWDDVDIHKVLPFTSSLPEKIRHKVSLFYSNSFGWVVVPHGWLLWSAGVGGDGGAGITFRAPTGWAGGWMEIESDPVCEWCIWYVTNGLVPVAFKLVGKDYQRDTPPVSKLVPKPELLKYPNPCMAILQYKPPKSPLTIRAVVQLNDHKDLWASALYLALPDKKQALADYLINRYRDIHIGGCRQA
ncbi:MAG: hypothetical protein ACRETC_01065 [Gammaproteobacteria bacterium]